jgi:hypothetical protein
VTNASIVLALFSLLKLDYGFYPITLPLDVTTLMISKVAQTLVRVYELLIHLIGQKHVARRCGHPTGIMYAR